MNNVHNVHNFISIMIKCYIYMLSSGIFDMVYPLHQIINYLKDKIGVVFLRSCVIFDTL